MEIYIVNEETDYYIFHNIMLDSIDYVERTDDRVYITQHKPVITLGRDSKPENIKSSTLEIPIYKVERGGDVTLHSPGQLMVYPIIKLDRNRLRLIDLIKWLEESAIKFLSRYGLKGYWKRGTAGVWVNGRKIASIGVAIRRWISYHGMALNISNDLSLFNLINPCGLPPDIMTSLSKELGRPIRITNELIKSYIDDLVQTMPFESKLDIKWVDIDTIAAQVTIKKTL